MKKSIEIIKHHVRLADDNLHFSMNMQNVLIFAKILQVAFGKRFRGYTYGIMMLTLCEKPN